MGKRKITSLVVSDSSPLISFAKANKLFIIQSVYEKIMIPPEVYKEIVVKGEGKPGAEEVKKADWFSIKKPKNQVAVMKLKEKLHPGEAEAIVLAKERMHSIEGGTD